MLDKPMSPTVKACSPHDHQACIEEALERAQTLCNQRGVRLTPLRKTVLELVWQNHKPLGAYALMSMLEREDTRKVAPPTVYRALDFLLENGLIHRVHRLNAYVGCADPEQPHAGNLLICRQCGVAQEVEGPALSQSLQQLAQERAFTAEDHTLEVVGLCGQCQPTPSQQDN
jgi:Fur family zinc uptake transcriptional regulator